MRRIILTQENPLKTFLLILLEVYIEHIFLNMKFYKDCKLSIADY